MSRKWVLKRPQQALQKELSDALHIHPFVAQLLVNRGVLTSAQAFSFLKPSLNDLHDPFLLKDMDKAVSRLKSACEAKETVLVYGDYDVDGVTSTAVLYRLLKKVGIKVINYIPHRMDEGYGLNYEIIPLAKEWGVSLLITVDCGVTSRGEILSLKKEGIDVIVIDHHEPEGGQIPQAAIAVVDPKRSDCTYPCTDLAGVGLAAKFAQAVLETFPIEDLDLVALGTIADVVPLRGENRIFARYGLPEIAKSSKHGVQALIESSRIKGKAMTPHLVGFSLGPRINAAGRMGSAATSLQLLLSDDPANAMSLAMSLEAFNRDRQRLQATLFDEAVALIEGDAGFLEDKIIVVYKESWHKGVLGIVASKISEKYGRPAIVISFEEGLGVGSARSIEGFHLNEAFTYCADILEGFGGHKRAAGLRVRDIKVADLRKRLNVFAEGVFMDGAPVPVIEIDCELPLSAVNMDLVAIVGQLEPFGEGNPMPIFGTRRLMVKSRPQTMGKDTIKFWVTDGRVTVSAVGFGMATAYADLRMGNPIDIVYTLGIDDWNKAPQVQIMLKDMRIQK